MSTSDGHILKRIASSDYLIVVAGVLFFLFLRWATFALGLPPLEWAIPVLLLFVLFIGKSFESPVLLLILITTGSLLGNLIHIVEDGLVPFSLFQIFYIFSLLVFVMRWFASGFQPIRKTGFELELALFFSLVFLSIIWTPDAERAFLHAIRIVVLSGLLFLFANWIRKPADITLIIFAMVAVGSVMGLLAIHATINNPIAIIQDMVTEGTRRAGRARIGQVDPNIFASLFFLPVAYTACLSFSRVEVWKRLMGGIFFLILIAAVMVTFSRSSWVAVLVMLLFLVAMYRQYSLFLFGAVVVLISIAVFPDLRYLFMNILNRFIDLFTGEVDMSNYLRIVLFETSIHIFFDSWMLGVGWRGFPESFLSYHNLQDTLGVYEPHNVIYLVYTELGLPGLLLFVFIVYKIFRMAWENIQMCKTAHQTTLATALFGAFLAYAVFYQFIGSGFLDNQLWITTGLIISLRYHLLEGQMGSSDAVTTTHHQ